MNFNQENIALFLILIALGYWLYCNNVNGFMKFKNDGNVKVPLNGLNGQNQSGVTTAPKPIVSGSNKLLKGSSGNVLSPVEPGVSTASLEDRLNQPPGIGWDSSALLPKMTKSGLDSISPVEFSKGDNFLKPQVQIGSVADSNRNPNLSLRRDPEITPKTVGPWQQSTIYADPYRKPLDCF